MAYFSTTTIARFWSKVEVGHNSNCWPWRAARKGRKGQEYGTFSIDGKMHSANRVAWEIAHNKSLGDRVACHECDNPLCCNPDHIYAGTHKTNRADAMERGRAYIPTGEERWRSRQDSNL